MPGETKCPHCEADFNESISCSPLAIFHCGSETWKDNPSKQSDQCRITQLENAIKTVCSQPADDKCWMDLKPLADLVGVELDMHVGDPDAMLKNCQRYVRDVCVAGGPWKTYAELEAEVKSLEAELAIQATALDFVAKQRNAAEWVVRNIMAIITTPEPRDEATVLYQYGFSAGQFEFVKK